jgi:UDP-N-acetylmuramate dehydrogenase
MSSPACPVDIMDTAHKAELQKKFGASLQFDRPMAQYTTFRIGGPVEAFFEATEIEALRDLIACLNRQGIPYLVLGWGSNLLVKDRGLEGVAIRLGGEMALLGEARLHAGILEAGAGLSISALLRFCRRRGYGGLEFLAGIPGTVGGAVLMNAGAFGKELGPEVEEIHTITPLGEMVSLNRSTLQFGYRCLGLEEGHVITGACLRVHPDNREGVTARIRSYLKKRTTTQPLEFPSAGSIFKNPPNDYAGRLIEKAGLKGKKIGGAMISEKHANFIINTGDATATDVLALLELARKKVREETGIHLEPEVHVVGR